MKPNIPQPLPASIVRLLDDAADKYGFPRAVARAVAWVESRGNASAVSSKGAIGVMQLMPATAHALGVANPRDAAQNIDGGVKYLSQLFARFGEARGLAAYNWGPGNVSRAAREGTAIPQQVQTYVSRVQARAAIEREAVAVDTQQPPAVEKKGAAQRDTPLPPKRVSRSEPPPRS